MSSGNFKPLTKDEARKASVHNYPDATPDSVCRHSDTDAVRSTSGRKVVGDLIGAAKTAKVGRVMSQFAADLNATSPMKAGYRQPSPPRNQGKARTPSDPPYVGQRKRDSGQNMPPRRGR